MASRYWGLLIFPPVALFWYGSLVSVLAGAVWLLLWAIGYGASLRINPDVPCRVCHGLGVRHGWIWQSAYHPCWCCKGEKGHTRWGARVFRGARR